MTRPNIQIDDEIREMTEEEYVGLLASGWTEEAPVVEEPATEDEPAVDDLVEGEQP